MGNKSNSLNRIKRHQREKVLRFSIRKYSFGAASVAVAALMFLGARVVSADTVSGSNSQSTAGVVQPNDKGDSPVGIKDENKSEVVNNALENKETALVENSSNTVDKSQLRTVVEELNSLLSTKLNLDDSVLSSVKERVQRAQALLDKADAVQKDINELKELLSADLATLSNAVKESSEVRESNTGTEAEKPASQSSSEVRASEENQTVSAKKDSLKVSVDQLKVAISEVPEHDTTKEVLKKANEVMVLAQGVLQNTTVSLTDVEQMNKLVKRMFISVKNATTRLSSGSHDPRNGQRMARGTQFRAYTAISSSGALENVRYFASVDKNTNGGQNTRNGDPEFTEDKTVIKSKYEQDSSGKWMVYDVYFNNNGRRMIDKSYGQHYYFQPPFNIMDGSTVQNVTITRYRNVSGRRLSDGGSGFEKVGDTVTISNPWDQKDRLFSNDRRSLYDPRSGVTRANQKGQVFKNNANDPYLDAIVKKTDGKYTDRVSYTLGMEVGFENADYAVHMTARVKLRGNVTEKEAANGNVYAASVTSGPTTNQSYIVGSRGTRLVSKPATPTITTETRYNGTLVSTDRRISGTGIAGATVTVTLQDGKTGTTKVDNNGRWTYNLKDNEKLTQNTKQDASIKAPNAISVTQTKDGVESPASRVDVQLAKAISIDTPVQAGRELAVKVAHDTGLFYLQVLNGNQTVYEYAVKQQNGNWVLEKGSDTTDLTVSNGDNVSEKKITLRIKDSHKKTNFPFKITGDNVVRVRAHHVNGKNNPADPANDGGWVAAAKATNTNPTITINNPRATYVADGTLTKDKLKTLVTVTDPEDDADKTVGSRAKDNLDVTATKNGKNVDLAQPLKQGTYNLTYRTTDAAGATVTKEHTITVNYTAVAKPTINLLQGETVSDEVKRSLVQLRDGNDVIDVPRDARVEVAVDTSSKTNQNKQAQATVVLADGTRLAPVTLSYRVLPTFPIARTVYDFKNVSRSDDESKYYLNTGIPGGMKWFAKRGNEAEIDASGLRDKINADPVGETTYKFGGKYNYGRFTDRPQPTEKLEHSATFTHKVFDIKPNDTKVTVAQGATLSEAQASAAVAKVNGSPDLPAGTTYEWVDAHGNKITPTASTAGVQTFKVKVTLPPAQSGNDAPEATKRQPSKIIDVPVNVAPSAPTITTETRYNGTLVSTDRRISGTGIAGAKVTVTLQDGKTGTTTVDNNGRWTYNLKDNEKLTQNTKQDASIKAPNAISVTQTKDGVESPASRVDVQLAKAISIDTPVQAGRELAVKVAHDTGLFYLQVLNGNQTVYEYAVKQQNGNWVLEKGSDTTDLTVSNGDNVSEKKITLRIKDSHKKTNFPFKITGDNVVRVRAHHVNGKNNPADPANDGGWVAAAKATNTNPTITINNPRATYVADGTLTKDKLKTLVTVTDPEDDADKTVGSRAKDNLDVTATKNGKNVDLAQPLKQGTYNLTYRTTDAAGATVTKEHTITVNYTAVAKPTINLLQGETVSDEVKRSLVQLRDGNDVIDVPRDARVEVAVDTSSKTNQNKQAQATVVLADGTRLAPVTLSYRVLPTFPVATKVYDFNGVARNQGEGAYYTNPDNSLPSGFDWFVRQNGIAKPDGRIQNYLRSDSVGTTSYVFGAKYREGRFSNNASGNDRLEHSGTVSHTVFDVGANTTRVMVNRGASLSDDQARTAVMPINNSAALPNGTTYEWVNQNGTPLTNKTVTEKGEATRYVKVTLPKTAVDGPAATQYQSYKIVEVKINESEKPKVSFNGSELSKDASNENSKFVIFRGATFNPTFTVSDNSGKVTEVKASGLPSGREFVKNTDTPNGNVQITGNDITATSNATLGDHIGKVLVKDASGNEQEYQFKYTVVDVEVKNTPEIVTLGTKLVDTANSRNGKDAHDYVKAVVESNSTGNDKYYPTNMSFKWSKDGNFIENTTTFDTPGIVKYKAVADFYGAGGVYTKTVEGIGNNIKIYAPDKIEREVTFLVKPNDIIRYSKNGDDVDKTTTTHTVDPNTGKITPTPNTVTHQKDGAKDTVVTQTIPVTTRYESDPSKDVGTNTVVNNGSEGSIVTTTPKLVNEITGEVTNGVPVVRKTEMVPKVVKVGTKPKVVETPIEKPVRYEADPTKPKGEKTTDTEGKDGKIVKTTPYIVNSDGSVTEGETTSVRTEPKEKVVKVGTQPKVETKVIPIETTYQEDPTKEVGNNEIIDNGSEGRVVTTTPYIVNDKTGEVTEGQPRVERTEMRPKVVKVGTKEAKRIPTVDVEQDPKTGDVTVTPKKPDGTPYKPGTKVEIPGKDGPITVTIGEDGKGKVPNSDLPEGKVSGPGKITEPNKPAVEVPKVETPAKVTPETPVTETPDEIEITQQPNGNAIVTPKKPDGKPYPSGSKVVIPGENNTPITVTIGNDGSGEVPNDNLPKKAVPGTGTVTEPNQKPSQPVDVTTPARKTPTVDVEQDPKTGDVTVTPKKPDGTPYKPGTKVEIPGKDGPITVTIGEDGKGKVPNSDLPEGKVSGPGKITEPNKPAVEVPKVETPAKVTPETPTDTNPVAPVTPDNNGGSGQDAPTPATPTPNADQVDTKTTMDNGAKSNDSQNVLPNTGTESNATLASLGLLGLLSGFGLVARKKKED